MKILLTNDDGYQAPGINALDSVLTGLGHEVWMIAPAENQSAKSHAMHLTRRMHLIKMSEHHYHCNGTPTDCILFGLKSGLLPSLPDIVVSGINNGYNLSSDILYSGTCGAASEAVMQGVRAVAVSQECDEDGVYDFPTLAKIIGDSIDSLFAVSDLKSFININAPARNSGRMRTGGMNFLVYGDALLCVDASEGIHSYELRSSEPKSERNKGDESDFQITLSGDIALSAITVLPSIDLEVQSRLDCLCRRV